LEREKLISLVELATSADILIQAKEGRKSALGKECLFLGAEV
jgi:hypothetical protein